MDKRFFDTLIDRRDAFGSRCEAPSVAIDIALHSGRTVRTEGVIEASDTFLQVDGVDRNDLETPISIAVPYHQIASVTFVWERPRMGRAGF